MCLFLSGKIPSQKYPYTFNFDLLFLTVVIIFTWRYLSLLSFLSEPCWRCYYGLEISPIRHSTKKISDVHEKVFYRPHDCTRATAAHPILTSPCQIPCPPSNTVTPKDSAAGENGTAGHPRRPAVNVSAGQSWWSGQCTRVPNTQRDVGKESAHVSFFKNVF